MTTTVPTADDVVTSVERLFARLMNERVDATVAGPIRGEQAGVYVELTGGFNAVLSLRASSSDAERLVHRLTGRRVAFRTDEMRDALTQLASMIAGNAKAELGGTLTRMGVPFVNFDQTPEPPGFGALDFTSESGRIQIDLTPTNTPTPTNAARETAS